MADEKKSVPTDVVSKQDTPKVEAPKVTEQKQETKEPTPKNTESKKSKSQDTPKDTVTAISIDRCSAFKVQGGKLTEVTEGALKIAKLRKPVKLIPVDQAADFGLEVKGKEVNLNKRGYPKIYNSQKQKLKMAEEKQAEKKKVNAKGEEGYQLPEGYYISNPKTKEELSQLPEWSTVKLFGGGSEAVMITYGEFGGMKIPEYGQYVYSFGTGQQNNVKQHKSSPSPRYVSVERAQQLGFVFNVETDDEGYRFIKVERKVQNADSQKVVSYGQAKKVPRPTV